MAEDGITIDEGKNPGAPSVRAAGLPPPSSAKIDLGAPLLTDVLAKLGRTSELSPDAIKYIETFTNLVQKELGVKEVEVARVPDKLLDIYRATYGNMTIMFTFDETYTVPSDTFIPSTEQIGPAATLLRETVGGILLNNIVITPADYRDVAKMAAHVIGIFRMASGKLGYITLDSLRKGKYSVSTNIADVRDAVKKYYPKATMPRADIGLVLYNTEEIGVGQQQGIRQTTPVLVICGFTNFVSTAGAQNSYSLQANVPSFMAVVTITGIFSPIMTPEMISIAIPLATEEFIRRLGWLKPYTKFGKKDLNLGNLIADDKGKPYFIENMPTLIDFVGKHIARPYLAIDITDGVPRIPGIEGLKFGNDVIQKGIARFLQCEPSGAAGEMVFQRNTEYIGEINEGDDSRNVDYLALVAAGYSDMNVLLRYLYIGNEPHKRAELISKMYDTKTRYTNVRVVLNAVYVDELSKVVASRFRPLWENTNAPENNIGALGSGTGANFQIGPVFGYTPAGSGWSGLTVNPFGPFSG